MEPKRGSILIVEDDADIIENLASLLQLVGHTVSVAENGRAALAALERGPLPDVILLDLMMPVMNGWEFRERQLADARWAHIPVVVLTGVVDRKEAGRALQPAAYLMKPFDVDHLFRTVEQLCP